MAAELNSRNLLVNELINRGIFTFAGYIQNEVNTSTLVLFKNLAKWCDIPFYQANKISTDAVYSEKLKEPTYTGWLKSAVEEYNYWWEDEWDRVEHYMNFCYELKKIPYNSSIAASGVIMGDFDATLPVHDGAIGYNGEDLEKAGYIKYDLLSVDTLNMIQYFKGLDFDWNDTDDLKVWETISNADTDFVFQVSSPGMKNILRQVKPTNIDTLAEINALYRPGPIEMGMVEKYIKMKTGEDAELNEEEKVLYDILKQEFGESHTGLVVYQEDVMKICQIGAGFTLAEADDIRKAMGKKKTDLLLSFKDKFIQNWKLGGDPEKIWTSLEGFGHYAFNKSHAVCYAIIAYHTAWLWTYMKYKVLEYCLNFGTEKRYKDAVDKMKELKLPMQYPTIQNMMGDKWIIDEDGTVHVPGNAKQNYNSYVEFLFSENLDLSLIYKGVCDKLTKDRYALAELATTCLRKKLDNAIYMESDPENEPFTKLEDILDGLKAAEAVVEWSKDSRTKEINVYVRRGRGNPSLVIFHTDNSPIVMSNLCAYDTKQFGAIRKGILSDIPFVKTDTIERQLKTLKERLYQNNQGIYAFRKMQNMLRDFMQEYHSNDRNTLFEDLYVRVIDTVSYSRSTKVFFEFNDTRDFFYVSGALEEAVKRCDKNALAKISLRFSPFIQRRTENFVLDFDIEAFEEVKVEE